MKAKLIKIGNSKGVRIPRLLLEESGLPETIDLCVEGGTIVIRPSRRPREGWEKAAADIAKWGDDKLLMDESSGHFSKFDEEEWEW